MFTTFMFITCLLWNDDLKILCILAEGERFNARESSSSLRSNLINCCIHVPSNPFPLFLGRDVPVALCLPFSAFLFPGSLPFDWGCRQKTGVAPSTFQITIPSAKAWCFRFAIRKVSIIEGLLDDSLISVCVIDAWERNDEDAVLAHQLLRMRKTTCFQQMPRDLAGSGNSPL